MITLKKGHQQLDGSQTLQAIRYRMYQDGDLGRIAVQQQIIKAILDKIFAESNSRQLVEIANELFYGVKTTISLEDLPSYIQILLATQQDQVNFYTLPGEVNFEEGRSYFIPDLEQSRALFH
jgi:anionic cell wall polymer biosynthesis LytR-Cps2A-Psr (LCP) family protein